MIRKKISFAHLFAVAFHIDSKFVTICVDKMNFNGKVILITGASSGIGKDAALHLAELGAKVSIVGRNEGRLNEVAEEIKEAGWATPLPIVADVTKDAERIVIRI